MDKQCCIDYFKFRFDNFVDMPDNEQEYMDDCKTGHEPGTADFVFINELCHVLLLNSQPNYIHMFIDSFVEAVYISKYKKIAIVLKLDDSNYLSKHNGSHDFALVEPTRLELATSSMPWRRSPR